MDFADQHPQSSRKRGRNAAVLNTNGGDARLTLQTMDVQLPVEYDDEDGGKVVNDGAGLVAWQHSSRIYRVSRATGGKDRHSKVLTSKGLRDRRVRLSVSTAIQFYDLQDRLGYDQPSKAVEWLINKASDAISELPSLDTSAFPPTPNQASDEKGPETEPEPEPAESDHIHSFMGAAFSNQRSACSSTSETSKGSALSLSRSANRVKARERARERAAKEKEKEAPKESEHDHVFPNQQGLNNPSTSFTQLLTGGGANSPTSSPLFALSPQNQNADHVFAKHFRHMSVMDYLGGQQPPVPAFFSSFGNSSTTSTTPPLLSGLPLNICTSSSGGSSDHLDQHLQQFSFAAATGADNHHHHHHMQLPAAGGNDYNLNFSISSSLTGFNRGTLQSNAPPSLSHHHHHHHQQQLHKFVSSMDGPPAVPFFVMSPGGTESNQFSVGFDGRLQLYHGDSCRHSDLKGKGKS